ncbi:HipA family kinase [Pseudoalteromonas sp. TB64]|uniref:HipA family kinase n=1 Tax=Pseudoalteromonas sp. TB64 TaxID=1938600 RepID=UPI00040105E7|nr:HipA family kinase [Pseudoalteromonas sp. TB64]
MIYIEKIIRKLSQGQTGPYLCVDDQQVQYVVKGPNTTYKGLINEFVCGQLGKAIGLPIPDFHIAYIDNALLEYSTYDLEEGDWFASKYMENIQDVPFVALQKLNSEHLKLLFIFDYWILNSDRTLTKMGGNPNLFIDSSFARLFVLDHNLAFSEDFIETLDDFKKLHVAQDAWFSSQMELFEKENYMDLFELAIGKLDQIFRMIPKYWLDNCGEHGILDKIRVELCRFREPEFWEGIK